jgi:hydrogenase maturation protease
MLIIGVGNVYRGDDGAGIEVARRLRPLVPPGTQVLEQSGEGTALMSAWEGETSVILLDAVHSGAAPGTVFRFNARATPLPTAFFRYSTHAFSVAEAVEVGRALGRLPEHVYVFGIEGACFDPGIGLTPAVEGAIDGVVRDVLALVQAPLAV